MYTTTEDVALLWTIFFIINLLKGDDDEEGKEKLPLVKDEPRGRRQPQKQGSAIDLDIGPPLEPNQVSHLKNIILFKCQFNV